MRTGEDPHFEFSKLPKKFPRIMLNDPTKSIAVYSVLFILRSMRKELSLEAMLEYMEAYLKTIETRNPVLKEAVLKTVEKIGIEKIYKDAMS